MSHDGRLDERIALITGSDSGRARYAIDRAKESADIMVLYLDTAAGAQKPTRRSRRRVVARSS
jgi:hypothetical protein